MNPFKKCCLFALFFLGVLGSAVHAKTVGGGPEKQAPFEFEKEIIPLNEGSLLEAIVMRNYYIASHEYEDAIVVVTIEPATQPSAMPRISGVVAFTMAKGVYLWVPRRGSFLLKGRNASDLATPAGVAAIKDAATILVAGLGKAEDPSYAPASVQLSSMFKLLMNQDAMGYFPATTGKVVGGGLESIIFDWSGGHYVWTPGKGTHYYKADENIITGSSQVSILGGNVVEAAVFAREFSFRFPNEQVVVPYTPMPFRPLYAAARVCAVYTMNGVIYVHSPLWGDVVLDTKYKTFEIDFNTPAGRYILQTEIENMIKRRFDSRRFGSVLKNALPCDDKPIQIRRAYNRLTAAGLYAEIKADPLVPNENMLKFGIPQPAVEYMYTPGRLGAGGTSYLRSSGSLLTHPNQFIEAITFTAKCAARRQGVRTIDIPYQEKGSNRYNSVSLFAENGAVYMHNTYLGDAVLSGFHPKDFDDPMQRLQLKEAAHKLMAKLAPLADERSFTTFDKMGDRQVDYRNRAPEDVFQQLKASGVEARLLPYTLERDDKGVFTKFPTPSVVFKWQGRTYTYGPEWYVTATDGFIARP